MANAADIAARSGIAQQAPVTTSRTREKDAERTSPLFDESDDHAPSFAPSERKVVRRETRKRSKLRTRQSQIRDTEGQKRSAEVEVSTQSSKTEKGSARKAPLPPAQGIKKAQNLLHQQSLLNQASIQFEQFRGPQEGATSGFGQQQAMLDSLIRMTEMLYHQHTGDKAGEIYHRPEARKILTALKGLKAGPSAQATSEPVAPRRSKREIVAQLERIERIQQSLQPIAPPADYEPLDLVA